MTRYCLTNLLRDEERKDTRKVKNEGLGYSRDGSDGGLTRNSKKSILTKPRIQEDKEGKEGPYGDVINRLQQGIFDELCIGRGRGLLELRRILKSQERRILRSREKIWEEIRNRERKITMT